MVVSTGGEGLEVEVSSDTSSFNSGMSDAINKLGGLRGAAIAASGAVAALGVGAMAKATSQAADLQEQMTGIERVTSSETVGPLRDELLDLNSEIPVSIDGLTDIAEQAGRLGISGPESISKFTESVAKISVATELTASEASENFAKIANALGTPISEIDNMGSAVNTLSQTTASSTDEILSSMRKAAPAASTLGVEFEDLAGMAATLTSAGMNAERAGTRLNRAFTKLASNTGPAAEALGMTQEEFKNLLENDPSKAMQMLAQQFGEIDSKTQRIETIEGIFGANASKAINTLATNTEGFNQNLDESADSYEKATSLQREFELSMEDFNSQASTLMDTLANLGATTGSVLLPPLTTFLGWVNTGASTLDKMNRATNGWMGTILGLTAVVGGAAGAVSAFGGASALASAGVGALAGAVNFLMSPVWLAVGAVVALTLAVGGLAAAWKNDWWGIRGTTEDTVNWVIQKLNDLIGVYNNIADRLGRKKIEPFDDVDFSKSEEAEQGGEEAAEANASGFKEKMAQMMGGGQQPTPWASPSAAGTAGMAAGEQYGSQFQSGMQTSLSDDTEIKSWTPEIRDALEGGVEGYKSEDLQAAPTEIKPALFNAMAQSKGGVSSEKLGVTQPEFQALAKRAGHDMPSPSESATVSNGASQMAGADMQARSRAGMSMGKHVKKFGGAVDQFKQAVDDGLTVVVETDDGQFGRAVDARIEKNNRRQGRRARDLGVGVRR